MPYVDLDDFGNYEVFYVDEKAVSDSEATTSEDDGVEDGLWQEGWYYWICHPGCLPDSEPNGPHDSEDEARNDVNEEYLEWLAQGEDE